MKVGVVGVGWAGRQHIEAYDAIDGVELIGIAGLEEDVRAELVAEHRVPHDFARWEDLLELDGLDAISVAVPTFLHAPIAVAALERGLHVLSEKPIALSGEQADEMVRAARDAGRVLEVVAGVLLIAAAVLLPVGALIVLGLLAGRVLRRRRRERALGPA